MRKEKIRETDYQQSERPRTRLAQFFDIFRHNFVELIKLALLQTVFNMPLLATLVTFHLFVRNATSLNSLMTVFIITGFALLISMISAFTGLTGSFYCLKNICYAEGEFASSSFFVGSSSVSASTTPVVRLSWSVRNSSSISAVSPRRWRSSSSNPSS